VSPARSVLVTGASGAIGRRLVADLAGDPGPIGKIVALDVRPPAPEERHAGVHYVTADIRGHEPSKVIAEHAVDTVVHLAAVVTPGRDSTRELLFAIDVLGTENVLSACLAHGVRKLVVTSSGAAYGYHPDNPERLVETDPLRGNPEFAYSDHKRQVEERLTRVRAEHPELRQLVFRPGTILGEGMSNQITAIFDRPVILGVRGADSPFCFVWDRDVVACLRRGVLCDLVGIYNLAGDGALPLREIARRIGKPYVALPAAVIRAALRVLHPLGLAPYGPEQVDFLRYRPVLANDRLRSEFGYAPELSSAEVFDRYWRGHARA
jgi:UDP-glucose 4-epimerase